jgi:extradiol dioxygenase family protein
MSVLGLAHYNFRLDRSLMEEVREFYEEVVGLKVGPRPNFNSFGYWLYAQDADILHLTEEEKGDERRSGTGLTFDHVALETTDWPTHRGRLQKRGIEYFETSVPQTGRLQVFFRDPAGNGVELIFPAGDA